MLIGHYHRFPQVQGLKAQRTGSSGVMVQVLLMEKTGRPMVFDSLTVVGFVEAVVEKDSKFQHQLDPVEEDLDWAT
jgi:hypothetical protein